MSEVRDELVLVLLPTTKDGARARKFLQSAGIASKVCSDLAELCDEIQLGAGAALLTEDIIAADKCGRLASALKGQAAWSDLPLVVLARIGQLGLSLRESMNVTLVEGPLKVRSLQSVVLSSLRSRRRQYEVREHLADRERQAIRLKESELRYRLVGEAANDAIWDWDLLTNDVVWNEGVQRAYGYAERDIGMKAGWWIDKIHPDDRDRIASSVHEAIDGNAELWQNEYRFLRADGTYASVFDRGRIVRQLGTPVRMVGAMLDLTERETAAATLKVAEDRFEFVRKSSGVGFWYCDLPFDVLQWDELVKEHFHLPADSPVTISTFYDRIHPDDRESTRAAIERSIRERESYDVFYRTIDESQSNVKWIRAIGRTSYSDDGSPIRFDGVTLDVTKQKRVESELREVAAALSEAGHRKDEFLATLAHELRNPLAPMRNAVHLMTFSVDAEMHEYARSIIERQLSQMVRLIDDLMDLSRISRGKVELRPELVSLADIIHSAVETSRPVIDQMEHILNISLPSEPVQIEADATRMSQVFSNLLNNASKYSERGTQINIIVEVQEASVLVHFRDRGIGIAPDQLHRIFEMFAQVDQSLERSQGGLGIGLTLVRRLVEMHGGKVQAKSEGLGMGADFVVELPLVKQTLKIKSCEETCDTTIKGSLRILIVDDNRDSAESLAMMLRVHGNETRVAYDGESGVKLAEIYQPDVILFDIGLPKMNGYEACQYVRNQPWGQHPVIIAVTGWGQVEDRLRSQKAGFNHHIVKPVDTRLLLRLLGECSAAT